MGLFRTQIRWKQTSAALGIAARHAGQTAVLIGHILLSAARAFTLGFRAVDDILFQCTAHAGLPRVDRLAVQMQGLDQRHGLLDRHAVTQHARNELGVVPELFVEQTRNAADGVRITVTVGVLEIIAFRTVQIGRASCRERV